MKRIDDFLDAKIDFADTLQAAIGAGRDTYCIEEVATGFYGF